MSKLTRVAPEIPVKDLTESVAYYGAKLGFKLEMLMPGGDYAVVERDGVALHLFHQAPAIHSPLAFHIFATGLDELFEELQKRGADVKQEILTKPWGTRDFRIVDPTGNEIKFSEPLS